MQNALDVVQEIIKLVKKFPHRDATLHNEQQRVSVYDLAHSSHARS